MNSGDGSRRSMESLSMCLAPATPRSGLFRRFSGPQARPRGPQPAAKRVRATAKHGAVVASCPPPAASGPAQRRQFFFKRDVPTTFEYYKQQRTRGGAAGARAEGRQMSVSSDTTSPPGRPHGCGQTCHISPLTPSGGLLARHESRPAQEAYESHASAQAASSEAAYSRADGTSAPADNVVTVHIASNAESRTARKHAVLWGLARGVAIVGLDILPPRPLSPLPSPCTPLAPRADRASLRAFLDSLGRLASLG